MQTHHPTLTIPSPAATNPNSRHHKRGLTGDRGGLGGQISLPPYPSIPSLPRSCSSSLCLPACIHACMPLLEVSQVEQDWWVFTSSRELKKLTFESKAIRARKCLRVELFGPHQRGDVLMCLLCPQRRFLTKTTQPI